MPLHVVWVVTKPIWSGMLRLQPSDPNATCALHRIQLNFVRMFSELLCRHAGYVISFTTYVLFMYQENPILGTNLEIYASSWLGAQLLIYYWCRGDHVGILPVKIRTPQQHNADTCDIQRYRHEACSWRTYCEPSTTSFGAECSSSQV